MTAPKWGGPWIGKVAAHGHWVTPDVVTIGPFAELAMVATAPVMGGPSGDNVFDSVSFTGAVGTASGANHYGSPGYAYTGKVSIVGTFESTGTWEGTAVSYRRALTYDATCQDRVGGANRGWLLVQMGFSDAFDGATPASGTAEHVTPAGDTAEEMNARVHTFTISITKSNAPPDDSVDYSLAVTGVSLWVDVQPPDEWVVD